MYPELLPWLVGLFTVSVLLTAFLLTRPVLRRLAMRQVVRRPTETALVALGSVLGTALILASLVVGDSLDRSVRQIAYDVLGPVDETVRSLSLEQGADVARRLASLADDPRVDGLLTVYGDQASAVVESGGRTAAEPRALVWELDFAEAAEFGAPHPSGLDAEDPGADGVVINENLAESLGVEAGEQVTFYLYEQPFDAVISAVVPAEGLGGVGRGASVNSNAYFSPGTLTEAAAAAGRDPTTTTFVSNRGDVEESAPLTDEIKAAMEGALGPLVAEGAAVATPKQDVLDEAEEAGAVLGSVFLLIGSFCIIAGVLLLVNVFVMLAGERRGQLGIMRAIGLRRRYVTGQFAIEGAAYAAIAAVVGALVGVGIGRLVVSLAMRILNSYEAGENQLAIVFHVSPTSVVNGVTAGFVIAFVTVVITSVRIARTNIIAAIRDLEPPVKHRTRARLTVLSVVATAAFVAASVPAIATSEGATTYLFPSLAAVSAVPLLARLMPLRAALTAASLAVLGWALLANTVRPDIYDDASTATYVVLGCALAFAAVMLVSLHQSVLLRPVRRLVERPTQSGLAARLAIAYPTAKAFRTGSTLAMYSVVFLVIVLMTQIMAVMNAGVDRAVVSATAGWSVRVDYSASAPIDDPESELGAGEFAGQVREVTPIVVGEAMGDDPRVVAGPPLPVVAVGFSEQLAASPLELDSYLPSLPNAQAAWDLVYSDPAYVFVEAFYGSTGGPPGETVQPGSVITLTDPRTGKQNERVVAGVVADGTAFYNITGAGFRYPILMSASAVETLGVDVAQSSALLRTAPGVDISELTTSLQGTYLTNGLVATDLRAAVEETYSATNQFFRLMQGYLALGLLVGITSLGVIMVRAVRERRRAIGVLRALGYQARTIRRAFLAESMFVAVEGVLIGAVLGVVTTWLLFRNSAAFASFDIPYPIAWTQIGVLVGITLVASLLATVGPARRAAAIRPAVAVRIAD
ncbi:MAG TPA: FtsX-like permease family protein [Jiangellaceae bacterium]